MPIVALDSPALDDDQQPARTRDSLLLLGECENRRSAVGSRNPPDHNVAYAIAVLRASGTPKALQGLLAWAQAERPPRRADPGRHYFCPFQLL